MPRSDDQLGWETLIGWVADERTTAAPVKWMTGRSQPQQENPWPSIPAWDHAHPVEHAETGERAYLLMPYSISDDGARQLDEWCHDHGLYWERLNIDGWWQSGTASVLVRCLHE